MVITPKNKKIHDPKLHLDIFGEIIKYAEIRYEIKDFKVEINSVSGEIIWAKKGIDVYATPFIEGDKITIHIMNDYYIELESISLKKEAQLLREGKMSISEFIDLYFRIIRRKLTEWKL